MNEKELNEIKARCEAATAGPWVTDKQYPNIFNVVFSKPSKGIVYVDNMAKSQAKADADFIAHARADVPALVAEVERLRAESVAICTWTLDKMSVWDTGCGERLTFVECTPKEAGCIYCNHCGKMIEFVDEEGGEG